MARVTLTIQEAHGCTYLRYRIGAAAAEARADMEAAFARMCTVVRTRLPTPAEGTAGGTTGIAYVTDSPAPPGVNVVAEQTAAFAHTTLDAVRAALAVEYGIFRAALPPGAIEVAMVVELAALLCIPGDRGLEPAFAAVATAENETAAAAELEAAAPAAE